MVIVVSPHRNCVSETCQFVMTSDVQWIILIIFEEVSFCMTLIFSFQCKFIQCYKKFEQCR